MKSAILILEQELAYAKANREKCLHTDDYYFGWCEALKSAIATLQMAEKASRQAVEADGRDSRGWIYCKKCGGQDHRSSECPHSPAA